MREARLEIQIWFPRTPNPRDSSTPLCSRIFGRAFWKLQWEDGFPHLPTAEAAAWRNFQAREPAACSPAPKAGSARRGQAGGTPGGLTCGSPGDVLRPAPAPGRRGGAARDWPGGGRSPSAP